MESNIKKCVELKQELDRYRPLKPEDEARIMQKFRLDWNYHSNHLEGNTLTYGETKALILFGITAQGKPLQDHFEVTGHNEALNWIIDIVKQDYPLTENFIRQIHTLLLKESYEKIAITPDGKRTSRKISIGEYKTMPNHVLTKTGEMFYFATPEETPAKMYDLINWYREEVEKEGANLLLLAAQFHYKFIRIHPFDDGNGRTARILMNFILMQGGYPPVIIKTEDKESYFSSLRQADAGIIEAFIDYIASNLVNSLEIMIKGAKGESIEEEYDITKKIRLLEQDIKNVGEQALENNTNIKVFFKNVVKLLETFAEKSSVLDKFYNNKHLNIYYNNTPIQGSTIQTKLSQLESLNEKNTAKSILFNYQYRNFNQVGFDTFTFTSQISFNFTTHVEIHIDSKQPYKKFFHENLSNDEISEIVNHEIQRHINFIEQKIKEKR